MAKSDSRLMDNCIKNFELCNLHSWTNYVCVQSCCISSRSKKLAQCKPLYRHHCGLFLCLYLFVVDVYIGGQLVVIVVAVDIDVDVDVVVVVSAQMLHCSGRRAPCSYGPLADCNTVISR